jgi:winged helix DNA-binding protein
LKLERLRGWSYARQLLDGSGASALEALRSVVAVYSTHPTAPLALLARCKTLTAAEFQGLEERREAIRIVGMRGSAFLVPSDTAAKIFAATRLSANQLEAVLRARGLDLDTYRRLTPEVLECCATPASRSQILSRAASKKDDVYMVARVLTREGRILRVGKSLRTDQLKYVATEAWLGQPLADVDPLEALAWLAGEYLDAFGPARLADFAWWAGVPRRSAAAALATLDTIELDGCLLRREHQGAFERSRPVDPAAVAVLPKWDSYTMGYAPDGRQRFIDDRFLSLAYTSVMGSPGATSGDGRPLLLVGGMAVGTWSHRFEGQRMLIDIPMFEGASVSERAFDAVRELLSASSVEVTTAVEARASRHAP